jgi:hypothetical protein
MADELDATWYDRWRVTRTLFALTSWILLASCSRAPEPCGSPGTCPEGQECLANRCVVAGGIPVSEDSQRLVLEPTAIAVVSAERSYETGLPPGVTFGSSTEGAAAIYLRFAPTTTDPLRIQSAFLLLEPLPGTLPSDDVSVDVWRVRESWKPERLSWLSQPKLAPPRGEGIARSRPPSTLRIDVTSIVAYLAENGENDFGMALESGSGDGAGASYATGAAGGRTPRLEVYLR